ncbi:MAG: hypothetical protein ASARMPREDX12_006826 [Alectoria sarmentosa]|nr:MAG: hypothetical protein ASARMPREDX12_006826 [Alectoria sarmentosa]
MIALEIENIKIIKTLLQVHADVKGKKADAVDRPLYIAAEKGNLGAVREPLDYIAKPQTEGTGTPLIETTKAGNIEIMEELLDAGAEVERENMLENEAIQ